MKRCLMILALCASLFNACVIDSSETSNYKFLDEAVANEVDDRFVFPLAMAETALLIDAYEGMTPEEKVGMGYIFRNLIKTGEGKYQMNGFYSLTLDTMGKSLNDPDLQWVIEAAPARYGNRIGGGHFLLSKGEADNSYRLVCEYEGYQAYEILFRVVDDEYAYFSWEAEMECRYTTEEGREVTMITDGPVVRKVYRKNSDDGDCNVMMIGNVTVDIKDHDVVRHCFDGVVRKNSRYDF